MNVITRTLLTLLFIFIGCSSINDFSGLELDYPFALPDSGDFYFPLSMGSNFKKVEHKLDTFSNEWYSKHLYSLKEPVLFNQKKSIEVYRYTNIGTWGNPFTYRIVKTDSIVTITKKLTDGYGGYHAGKLIINQTKKLPREEWDNLIQRIERFEFWTQPTHIKYLGMDGTEWILEGYKDGKYHYINRWCPNHKDNSPFVEVCNSFEELFDDINSETDTE
ncbi:MAG: hypothetical protein WC121_06040 [Candidatus Kapaibacterium sp.]